MGRILKDFQTLSFGVAVLTMLLLFLVFMLYDAYIRCPNSCFINRDGKTWCEMRCWDLMKMFHVKPNPTLTECQMWGICGVE